MTAMNFPLNPSDGDIHDNYVYDATHGVWNANPQQIISRFISSDTAPTNPSAGDGWFDSETGKTYIYHDSSWVESGNPVIGFVDPYDQDSTSTGYFSLPKGTDAQRPVDPSNGDMRFNTELGEPEWYSEAEDSWILFKDGVVEPLSVQYLVVAGGGGGGGYYSGGGGGAGGYRSSVAGESSGRGAPAETVQLMNTGTLYSLTVGGGGTRGGSASGTLATNGFASVFDTITSAGGGAGGNGGSAPSQAQRDGDTGGSGGGGGGDTSPGAGGPGTALQGYDGGSGSVGSAYEGGGGGGAGGPGGTGNSSTGTAGGIGGSGVSSSITGTPTPRAGGGGGGNQGGVVPTGTDGGGDGGNPGNNATPNTGSGGGGTTGATALGGNGASGIVILKYPSQYTITAGPGLTSPITSTIGDYKITQFTGGTDTISFS